MLGVLVILVMTWLGFSDLQFLPLFGHPLDLEVQRSCAMSGQDGGCLCGHDGLRPAFLLLSGRVVVVTVIANQNHAALTQQPGLFVQLGLTKKKDRGRGF